MGAAATNPQNSSQESMMEEKIAAVEKPKVRLFAAQLQNIFWMATFLGGIEIIKETMIPEKINFTIKQNFLIIRLRMNFCFAISTNILA